MSKNLTIGASGFALPLDLATGSIAILAIKGSGKTYTSAVLTEELIEKSVPVTIIDPTGVHWGLKSSASGKSAGFPVTIFGGDHADLPLEEGAGEVLARWIVERRFSCILDLSHFRKAQIYRFLTPFLLELYRLNRSPMHLVADEADLYAPQRAFPDVARCLGAMEDIVRRGRARGIGTTLITQRPASLNKDVLTQCDCLMALRISHPRDIAPVMEWIDQHGDRQQAAKMLESLAGLPTGNAWVWAPRAEIFERIQIRRRTTFDSSSTPKIGQVIAEPTVVAKIDLEALGKEISETVQRAKENDPAELKREIARLKAVRLVATPAPAPVQVPVMTPDEIRLMQAGIGSIGLLSSKAAEILQAMDFLKKQFNDIAGTIALRQQPKQRPYVAMPLRPTLTKTHIVGEPDPNFRLGRCERAILIALAQHGPSERTKVAAVSGYSVSSGGFANSLATLRVNGYIEGTGQSPLSITASGTEALGEFDPLPTGQALIDQWANRLGKCERAIFLALVEAYPNGLDREQVAIATNYSADSGGFANSLSSLRTLELITRTNPIKASQNLFQ